MSLLEVKEKLYKVQTLGVVNVDLQYEYDTGFRTCGLAGAWVITLRGRRMRACHTGKRLIFVTDRAPNNLCSE